MGTGVSMPGRKSVLNFTWLSSWQVLLLHDIQLPPLLSLQFQPLLCLFYSSFSISWANIVFRSRNACMQTFLSCDWIRDFFVSLFVLWWAQQRGKWPSAKSEETEEQRNILKHIDSDLSYDLLISLLTWLLIMNRWNMGHWETMPCNEQGIHRNTFGEMYYIIWFTIILNCQITSHFNQK